MFEKIPFNQVSNDIRSTLYRIQIRDRHIEQCYLDTKNKIVKIQLKQQYRLGTDPVELTAEDLRFLFRSEEFLSINNSDRREGLIFLFTMTI